MTCPCRLLAARELRPAPLLQRALGGGFVSPQLLSCPQLSEPWNRLTTETQSSCKTVAVDSTPPDSGYVSAVWHRATRRSSARKDYKKNLITTRTKDHHHANMEAQVDRLVQKAWTRYQQLPPTQRLMIAVSGIPGSGKSTLAAQIALRLNARHHAQASAPTSAVPAPTDDIAIVVPLDGFHLTRAQLSAMPDPVTAHARRGAAFTFDAPAFLALVRRLRAPLDPAMTSDAVVRAPSFDHAVKDPVADDIAVPASARVVLLEGNYLSLAAGAPEWRTAAALMDERWFVEVGEEVARKRLVRRHVKSGVAGSEDEARRRVEENDLVNGREIVQGMGEVDEVVVTEEEERWRGGD